MGIIKADIKGKNYYLRFMDKYARPWTAPVYEGLKNNATKLSSDKANEYISKVVSPWLLNIENV